MARKVPAVGSKGIDQLSKGARPESGASGIIAPEDSFLVQIRGGSRLSDRAVLGRIEHLHSGQSEQFGSLAELLAFVARHFGEHDRETGAPA
jgi:hypothetical protein